jgi:hypothetical protein
MGVANVVADAPAMTGTLTVRYRKPTPLLAPLDLVARFRGRERRKIFTWAGIYHEGALTAEADGIFIGVQSPLVQEILGADARWSTMPCVPKGTARADRARGPVAGPGSCVRRLLRTAGPGGLLSVNPLPAQHPTLPSRSSRMRSACPLCRAYSSIMCV